MKETETTGKKQAVKKDTRFKPGQSGNPKGRPKGTKHFSTVVDEFIKKEKQRTGKTTSEVWEELIGKQFSEANKGNFQFFKDLMDRYYGKPKESVEVTGDAENPIRIIKVSKMKELNNEE